MRHLFCLTLLLGVVFVSGGASCVQRQNQAVFPAPPPILATEANRDSVLAAVNRTDAVRQLSSNSAHIRDLGQKTPRLPANIHLQRDKDFRLRAKMPILGGEALDIGSNRDVFWFEVPDGMTRTMYFARHDQYVANLDQAIIPINPAWLIEAIGLVHLDPNLIIAGPVKRQDGLLEIRSWMQDRIHQRVCYIDPVGGYVKQQVLTKPNPGGAGERILAESRTGDHRYNEAAQCVLPHLAQIQLLPVGAPPMNLQIEIDQYAVNQILSAEADLFVMPQTAGKIQDLNRLSAAPIPASTPSSYIAQPALETQLRGRY